MSSGSHFFYVVHVPEVRHQLPLPCFTSLRKWAPRTAGGDWLLPKSGDWRAYLGRRKSPAAFGSLVPELF